MPIEDWIWLNRTGIFEDPSLRRFVSPFPPAHLMENVSGLQRERDFASHGSDFYIALSNASPQPLTNYRRILDFGCGCGRLARMFHGHPHQIYGCDIDHRHIEWSRENLPFMHSSVTSVHPPLPYADNMFDAIISISIFTHLNESSQNEFLTELHRISRPGSYLFLTVHGERALHRAITEESIRAMISVDEDAFQKARVFFFKGNHAFILQHGHLTTTPGASRETLGEKLIDEVFEYGITFIPEAYIRSHWEQWFTIQRYCHGAIHDFQDIVVCSPRK